MATFKNSLTFLQPDVQVNLGVEVDEEDGGNESQDQRLAPVDVGRIGCKIFKLLKIDNSFERPRRCTSTKASAAAAFKHEVIRGVRFNDGL